MGNVYDLTFDSETRFYLKMNRPGWHVQIPYNIFTSPSGRYSHLITEGEPIPLLKPRATPPYILDANWNGLLTRSPGRSVGSHQGMYEGAAVVIFGMVCRSSWLGMMGL